MMRVRSLARNRSRAAKLIYDQECGLVTYLKVFFELC